MVISPPPPKKIQNEAKHFESLLEDEIESFNQTRATFYEEWTTQDDIAHHEVSFTIKIIQGTISHLRMVFFLQKTICFRNGLKKRLKIGIILSLISMCYGAGDWGSIPGRVIPKTQKTVLDVALLNSQHYKVQIQGKVEQSKEWSCALPYTLVQQLLKREPSGHP